MRLWLSRWKLRTKQSQQDWRSPYWAANSYHRQSWAMPKNLSPRRESPPAPEIACPPPEKSSCRTWPRNAPIRGVTIPRGRRENCRAQNSMETQKGVGSVSQRNLADYSSGVAIPEQFFIDVRHGGVLGSWLATAGHCVAFRRPSDLTTTPGGRRLRTLKS